MIIVVSRNPSSKSPLHSLVAAVLAADSTAAGDQCSVAVGEAAVDRVSFPDVDESGGRCLRTRSYSVLA